MGEKPCGASDVGHQRDSKGAEKGAAGVKDVAEKWAGLCLDGLKGSAPWPIRKERLMSADFLAETGVLPKVGRSYEPYCGRRGSIRPGVFFVSDGSLLIWKGVQYFGNPIRFLNSFL